MPVRSRIMWGAGNPFDDPRLANLPVLIRNFRRGRLPFGWRGNKEWTNRWMDLPVKPQGYYREFYIGTSEQSGEFRLVLGKNGEVYLSGNHHRDCRQIVGLPILE